MINRISKGNPKWVRQGQGNKTYGDFHWEYRKDGRYYAQGFFQTAQEAHEDCIKHQELMELWHNPEKYKNLKICSKEK